MTKSAFSGVTEEQFVNAIRAGHRGLLMRKKLRTLHHIAETSISIDAGAQSVSSEISFLVEKLHLIKRHIRSIDETLVRLVNETEEGKYPLSINGLNYISVAGLLPDCTKCLKVQGGIAIYLHSHSLLNNVLLNRSMPLSLTTYTQLCIALLICANRVHLLPAKKAQTQTNSHCPRNRCK